ncbi:peptide-binding protein [Colwellia sp. 75C3]|uniref:type I polyketide synthase n=1 Tax=Colwellia sp. 75C3 TaxID=888425 RepID=UPI000C33151A|nr:type I polyketide synthase [Colwellia sp. 75C3]PKG84305.1 peptide-binding protein [Colwellia sp. 75C3]
MTKKQQPTANNPVLSEADEKTFNSRLQECPIAIVGMASIFADAKNLEDYWDNIFESVNGIKDVPKSQWDTDEYYDSDPTVKDKTYCKRGGFLPEIDFDPMEFGLPPNILELTDISQLLSLVVAREVLNDAGIGDGSGYDRDKVGITLGVGGGQKQIAPLTSRLQGPVLEKVLKASGVDAEDRAMIIEKFKKAYIGWEENSFPGMLGNVIAGRIANRFDFGGTNCVVDAACASSLSAIKLAVSDLLEYRSEVMISGGVCCDNSPFMYMSFAKTPAFTTNDDIRPFDVDSKGMMIGEGIGMMAFKRLEDAERDGDKIYAVLKGIGTSSDGRFKSIYAPRPDGQAKALKRAYDDAGFDPKSCGLIEAHGTGTKAGDAAEFSGLLKHFSHNNDATQHIALGSVKSQIGHTKAAAGAAGMIKAVLALHHKVLPATINIDTPNPALDIENSPLYLNNETRPWMPREDGLPRRAGISSFGFGGTNFHMVLEEYQAKAAGKYRLNAVPQTLLFNAKDEATLITLLNNWQSKLSVGSDEQVFVFNALVTEHQLTTPEANEVRCGFVAKNALEAVDMINIALKQLSVNANSEAWTTPTGLYYRKSALATAGKVVALFSGQGSQYLNMGRELACNFPTVMQAASDMDSQFSAAGLPQLSSTSYPIPVFNADARKVQDEALRLTQHAQPAIGTFSVGLYKTFTQAGFKADFTAGHSFGELTALWAAGVLSEQDYMMLARSRGQAMAKPSADDNDNESNSFDAGTMVAVVGEPEKVAAVIKDIADISIANYNSNNQVVVAGVTSQIVVATQALTAEGFKVVPLPVSAAFHTPLVAHAQKPFAQAIDRAKFTAPSIPVFANGTGKAHSNKATDIKKALKKHILESVHFNKEIENIYADGGRVFVEFGPKNVLTKLVDNILQDKNDVVTIAVNANAKKSSDKQLRQAAVQLAVLGVSLDDIDPHNAVKRPLAAVKMSPLAMKLTGKSYVSAKTEKAFADALADGRVVKQAKATSHAAPERVVEKIVEKIVEVERIVEVEKIVYLNADGTIADGTQVSQPSPQLINSGNNVAADIERSVSQFVEHQQQVLNVHEQYMQGPKDYAKTVDSVLTAVASDVPESVERTLNMYHDFQSQTLRVHEQYLNNQSDKMSTMLSGKVLSNEAPLTKTVHSNNPAQLNAPQQTPVAIVTAPSVVNQAAAIAKPVTSQVAKQAATAVTKPVAPQVVVSKAAVVATVATVTTPATPVLDLARIQTVMMEVVADKTGYPTEMLELGMDMEADLGIDSIKRVEILGSVQEIINDLPELNPEDLAELRTLGEIVSYMQSKVTAAPVATVTTPTASAPVIDLEHIQTVMMEVVADKTGYPTEMLELGMDMEADLGIDSIKRVEILGSVQEIINDLPELNPEDLAELRTLGEIVSYMQSKVEAVPLTQAAPVVIQAAVATVAIDLDHIQTVMMEVVADKTGYPTEMLELGMDMEADLGIDSIKRVEILGAVQEIIEDLPELNPEDLAELRTLGEIVSYMQSKVEALPAASVVTQAPSATVAIDLDHIQNVMMEVVADKTGYPTEMLELGMDMEADLGIDSIKRVEILGAVQEIIEDLPELNPEDLAELRTLGEIVSYMQSKVAALPTAEIAQVATSVAVTEAPVATVAIDLDHIQNVMMEVVADKTGYPPEMLELAMDMEADLGIDSIKRVEILGAVQEIIEDLPELNPEDLAELRTLGEIVSYMQSKVAPLPTAEVVTQVPTTSTPAIDLDHIQNVMMQVVADKTGYPPEMLELAMDMEADLGIDSIKRVEILGAVQEIIEDLPELNPEDLAELRTLGEIVSYMQSKVAPVPPTTPTPPTSPSSSKTVATEKSVTSISTVIADPAPSAVVALQALSSVTKIVQDFNVNGHTEQPNALVVDDGSGAAVAVSSKLLKEGWQVTVLKPNWLVASSKKTFNKAVNLVEIGSNDKTVDEEQVKKLLEQHAQLDAVIYLQAKNTVNSIDNIEYAEAAKQGLMLAFVLAKLCQVKSAKVARASFVVVTRQGGTLGFTNTGSAGEQNIKADLHADLVQGGLGGLVKTLSHEWRASDTDLGVFCRVIDLSAKLAADKAATIICDELLDINTSLIEVAHDTDNLSQNLGKRLTLVGVKTDSYALEQKVTLDSDSIDSNSVFLVSGGAKGVTAHCVIEIAKQHKAKFILLGRSPLLESEAENSEDRGTEPSWANGHHDEVALKKAAMQVLIASGEKPTPVKVTQFVRPILANREIVQTLTAIKAAGGHAQYVAADVTDSQSVSDAVAPALAALAGTSAAPLSITGIIHGAGVLADKFIEQKTLAEFDAVYRTKIDGLLSLMAVCQPENIKHLVLFSSAAGFYGNPGQSDYSIANDILNKTAYRFKAQHPNAQVLSFNWGPWDGGMVTPELKRMFNARGVYIIPLDAGAKLLVSELNANTNRCAQILVGNDLSKSPENNEEKAAQGSSLKKSQVSRLSARVIKTLQATNNTFLADHVIGDDQVLPTVCAIAWMSDAAQSVYSEYVYQGINDYKLFKGVTFDKETLAKHESKDFFIDMQIDMNSQVDGGDTLLIDSKISSVNDAGKIVFHYSGQVVLVSKTTLPTEIASSAALSVVNGVADKLTAITASEAKALYQNGTLFHGESLQGITQVIECDENGLLLGCKVPEVAQHKQGDFPISTSHNTAGNIFANDLAYQAMLVWVKRELGLGSLPSSTQAWHVHAQVELGQTFYLQLKVVQSSPKGRSEGNRRGKLVADINFISENGLLLAEMKSAKVTASDSLNDMFLPAISVTKVDNSNDDAVVEKAEGMAK